MIEVPSLCYAKKEALAALNKLANGFIYKGSRAALVFSGCISKCAIGGRLQPFMSAILEEDTEFSMVTLSLHSARWKKIPDNAARAERELQEKLDDGQR